MARLQDLLSSDFASIAIPIASTLLAPRAPKTVQGGLLGLGAVSNIQRNRRLREEFERKRAQEKQLKTGALSAINQFLEPTTEFQPQIETAEDMPVGLRPVETPPSAQRQQLGGLFRALAEGGQAGKMLELMGTQITKVPEKPQIFGGPEVGYHVLPRGGTSRKLVSGRGPRLTPFKMDIGGEVQTGVVHPYTGERTVTSRTKKTSRPMTELEKSRKMTIDNALAIAKDPKRTETVSQLAVALNSINNTLKSDDLYHNPDPEFIQVLRDARRALVQEIASRRRRKKGAGATKPKPKGQLSAVEEAEAFFKGQ